MFAYNCMAWSMGFSGPHSEKHGETCTGFWVKRKMGQLMLLSNRISPTMALQTRKLLHSQFSTFA